jgi:hypothetical protein
VPTRTRHLTRAALAIALPLASLGLLVAAPAAQAASTGTPAVGITEVAPWGSSTSAYGADWWELTNFGSTSLTLSGWTMNDSHSATAGADALTGITTLHAGESALFVETTSAPGAVAALRSAYSIPASVQIGSYSGGNVGLSTGGDSVNVFSGATRVAGVSWTATNTGPASFDNAAGADGTISTLSQVGVHGATSTGGNIVSPGTIAGDGLRITEVAPWSSSNSPFLADWFELTNTTSSAINVAGWMMDDSSHSFSSAVPMVGISSIAAGESVVYAESTGQDAATVAAGLRSFWNLPAGVQVGTYAGSGVGLSTGGDEVDVWDTNQVEQADVTFGASNNTTPPFQTFDNTAGVNFGAISALSQVGLNGAYEAGSGTQVDSIGSPGSATAGGSAAPTTAPPTTSAPSGNLPWPGSSEIDTVDTTNFVPTSQGNLSGLAYVPSGTAATGQMWAIDNGGPAELFKLAYDGTNWTNAGGNWAAPKTVHYPDGSGEPDSEGVTVGGDGGIYVSTERDNDVPATSKPSILRFDPNATGSSIDATAEWDVGPAMQQGIGANLGLEAISYIPDSYLVANGLYDSNTGQPYNPDTYPNHGTGLYFAGLEANGTVYGFALDQGGTTYHLVTQFTSGFNQVMDSDFDAERGVLWEHCDNGCGDATTTLAISSSTHTFAVTAKYDPPAQLPTTQNDEGFTIAPDAECVNNLKPVYFADDTDDDGHSLRRGFITCGVLPTTALPEFPLLALPILSAFAILGAAVWTRRRRTPRLS